MSSFREAIWEKLRWGDFVVAGALIALVIFTSLAWFHPQGKGSHAVVHLASGQETRLPLNQDGTFEFEGKLGPAKIEVKDGSIRMLDSACANKLCIQMGSVSHPGQSIICLPNQIWITIDGEQKDSEVDAITR